MASTKPVDDSPQSAVGLTLIDIGNSANIRIKAFTAALTPTSSQVQINAWADTKLYGAACTSFNPRDPDFQFGQFSTGYTPGKPLGKTAGRVSLARAYGAPPKVVVWLNEFDMEKDKNWRLRATATDIDAKGFTIHLDTWADTTLWSAEAAWIAYPADKAGVASGSYSTEDSKPGGGKPTNSGRIEFPSDTFGEAPTVLIALDALDVDHDCNLRVKVAATRCPRMG